MKKDRRYNKIVRILAVVTAIVLWGISIQFSANGFNFQVPGYKIVGYLLGLAVTVIELVFNEDGQEHTITLLSVGILAYIYGVYTNIYGLWIARGSPDVLNNPVALGLPVILGLMLEIIPEPLLLWGMGLRVRDVIGHIFGDKGNATNHRSNPGVYGVQETDVADRPGGPSLYSNGNWGGRGRFTQAGFQMGEEQPEGEQYR